ncbi:hypothetical protein GCM10007147_30170 [Nocardiopsis kunsanensis]|uniref:RING-type E3 ubiquitin transferase n=1 Tax=Nocardiopsis kunsanensis TaxID=141693 RepID=A0A918XFT6_9ACTN|nr:hypothetical protein GCM10007147_30170 [Nocardiopsis kunsanensis]
MLLVIGSALLVAAVVLLPLTVIGLRRWLRRRGITRLRPATLASHEGERLTLTGVAAPGPEGTLSSSLAGNDCVWHGHEVLRHYWPLNRDTGDSAVRERACDSIADHMSEDLFGLVAEGDDPKGERVFVDPAGCEQRGAELCLQRLVERPKPGVATVADDLLSRVKGRISGVFRGETIEFEYREWVIRPGRIVRVTGVPAVRDGQVVITAPEGGKLLVEPDVDLQEDRTPPRRTEALSLTAAFTVCAVAGSVLLLLGISVG